MKAFKRLIFIMFLVFTISFTSGCKNNGTHSIFEWYNCTETYVNVTSPMVVIEGKESLVYHNETKVIYIMIASKNNYNDEVIGYFAPYISQNGKYCRYVDGEIIEID